MISVIIINYMTYEVTIRAIESVICQSKDIDYEIIVVDNGSPNLDGNRLKDYSLRRGGFIFFQCKENLGFAAGNNYGLEFANGDYILFLNSDTELTKNSLKLGVDYMENNPSIGALGTRLITPDGNLDHGCKRGFPTPMASMFYYFKLSKYMKDKEKYDAYKLSYLDDKKVHCVDVVSGAFLMMRKSVIDEVGSFDDLFFMYGEDIDLCYRIKNYGYEVVYNPDLGDVIHYKGQSMKKRKVKTIINFYDSMILFYNKNYLDKYLKVVQVGVYLAVYFIMAIKLIFNVFARAHEEN